MRKGISQEGLLSVLFDPFTVKWACAFVGSEDVPARGRSRVASQRCSQTRTRSRPSCGISTLRWLRKMIRRAFCSAAMAAHRASSYAIADQLSCGTTQERRTLVLRAPDGPHRAMDCRRIRQRVGSRRVATRRVGGFRAVERSGRIRSGTDTEFVLGSAVPHNFDLVLGSHSVHTTPAALPDAQAHLSVIRTRLVQEGRL